MWGSGRRDRRDIGQLSEARLPILRFVSMSSPPAINRPGPELGTFHDVSWDCGSDVEQTLRQRPRPVRWDHSSTGANWGAKWGRDEFQKQRSRRPSTVADFEIHPDPNYLEATRRFAAPRPDRLARRGGPEGRSRSTPPPRGPARRPRRSARPSAPRRRAART